MSEILPEGTDQIIPGAASTARDTFDDAVESAGDTAASTRDRLKSETSDLRDRATSKASAFAGQATDKARDYAEQGKARASGALDEVARMIGDTAGQIDEKLGDGYGQYARRAAEAVSGAASTLRDKNVDELLEDARGAVRNSPAIAIGAAAAAGFVLARIIKAGSEALDASAKQVAAKTEEATAVVAKAGRKGSGKTAKTPPGDA